MQGLKIAAIQGVQWLGNAHPGRAGSVTPAESLSTVCHHPHSWGSAQLQNLHSTGLGRVKKPPIISFSIGMTPTVPKVGTLSWISPLAQPGPQEKGHSWP